MREDIENALKVLNSGGIILYPTDTIWGIGCDATNENAVKRIYEIKRREDTNSMLVLLSSLFQVSDYVKEVPEEVVSLLGKQDKPTTIIYQGAKRMAANLISKDRSIGIRIPNHEFCQRLLCNFNKPLVSTSANISGTPYPKLFSEIEKEIVNAVDYIVEWEQDKTTEVFPSAVLKIEDNGQIIVIRK